VTADLAFLRVIAVVIADAQPLFRDGLARVIRQDAELQLLAEATDGRAILASIRELGPRVALVARELSGLDGSGVLAAVAREGLATRMILLDPDPGPEAWDLLGDGAAGVLSRRVTPDALRAAVHRVADGGTVLCDEVQAVVATEIRGRRVGERPLLSPREQQILELIGDGLSAPQIGRRLHLATSTVRTHHKHLLAKLEAGDRAQLVRHAMRRKLLD
jgi:two-component system, NarL family, nitrate/nitrite response regulator NarL